MSAKFQLLLILVNIVYGIIIFFVSLFNYNIIKNEPIIVKFLLTILFAVDFTIIYLVLIYKLNYGIFNYYYLISFLIGYYLGFYIKKHVNFLTKIIDHLDFLDRK